MVFAAACTALSVEPVREPTLILNSSGIAAARMRIATDADAKTWWLGFKSRIDEMVAVAKPVPTAPGQSFNLYLCKYCGAGLERWRQDGRHVCSRSSCRREHFGWPYDDVRVMREHYDRIAECQDCAIAYLLSDDSHYAKHTIDLLKTYAARYRDWPLHDQNGAIDAPTQPKPQPKRIFGGHISAQILDECILAVKFARAYDAVRMELDDEDRRIIEEGLLRPLHKLALASSKSGWENHQLWHLSALGCLSFVLEDEPSARLAMDGPHGFRALLNHTVNADGMWNEGSWLYHFFSMRAMIPFFTAVVNRGGQIPLEFKAMFRAPFRQRTPDGCLPKVNDSARCDFRRGAMTELYEMAYAWWGDSDFGWWVGAKPRTTMEYVLYGRPGTPETMMKEESAALDATGLAFLRSPTKSCVMVNYDDYGGWHSHYDKLGLSLWGHGEALCEDPGSAPYASPLHWGWFRTSLAHSTLMADGKRQNHAQPLPNGKWPEVKAVRFRKFEDGAFVSVDGGSAVPDARTGRMTMIRGDVVMDLVWGVSEKEREWELSFHSYGECSVSVERDVVPVLPSRRVVRDENGNLADGDGSDAWAWVEDAREGAHGGMWNAEWLSGSQRLNVWRNDNVPGILRAGKTPSIPSARLVSDRVRGKNAVYATVMVVSTVEAEPPMIDFGEISFNVEDPHSSCFTAVVNGKEYNIGN